MSFLKLLTRRIANKINNGIVYSRWMFFYGLIHKGLLLFRPLVRGDGCPGYISEIDPYDTPEDNYNPAALADEWMSRLDSDAGGLVRRFRSENPGKRVKIAILDTGIDTRNVAFAQHVSKGLIKVEDFVAPGGDGLDMNGHGTHSAALLCKIAPEAEIYVAKVVASRKRPPSPSLVAKVRCLSSMKGALVLT
jgi:hypothetical protein